MATWLIYLICLLIGVLLGVVIVILFWILAVRLTGGQATERKRIEGEIEYQNAWVKQMTRP